MGGNLIVGDLRVQIVGLKAEHNGGIDGLSRGQMTRGTGGMRAYRVGLGTGSIPEKRNTAAELVGRFPGMRVTIYDHQV